MAYSSAALKGMGGYTSAALSGMGGYNSAALSGMGVKDLLRMKPPKGTDAAKVKMAALRAMKNKPTLNLSAALQKAKAKATGGVFIDPGFDLNRYRGPLRKRGGAVRGGKKTRRGGIAIDDVKGILSEYGNAVGDYFKGWAAERQNYKNEKEMLKAYLKSHGYGKLRGGKSAWNTTDFPPPVGKEMMQSLRRSIICSSNGIW